MKQQAGIGILLALTTAICWGALPIAMKQVLEVMEPPTIVFYRFLMASIGLGAILAVKKRLPPLRDCRAVWELHPVQLILAIPESDRFAGDWATLASWHDGCQRIYPERENAQYSGCRGIDAPERPGDVF